MPSRWTRFDMLEHQCTESPCLAGRRVCCSESKSEGRSQAWSGEERGVVWSSVVWCRCRWSCCLLIAVFGLVLGPAHGTGRCYQHPLAGHAGFTSACFHSRPSTPVINSCYLPVQSRADHLCLPRSLALIVIFASLGQPTAAPFTVRCSLLSMPAAQIITTIHRLSLAAPAPHFQPTRAPAVMFQHRANHGRCCSRHLSRGRLIL